MPEDPDEGKKKRKRDKNAPKEVDQVDKPLDEQYNWKFYKKLVK